MRFTNLFVFLISLFYVNGYETCDEIIPNNGCVSFSVGPGTGCANIVKIN